MTRVELTISIAGALLTAFAIGWLAHWLWSRAARVASPRGDRADELAAELLEIEAERDRISAEAAAEVAAAAALLREREAELSAAMDGLGAARAELAALRGER
ncbi:hypothetical protein G5B40_10740 [Pikeienuella piscinae]|uniref:Uncharacterized protein n=1 Tax=Pikeienuella piscinae TaxID=2748098 RepID=A0A7L5BWQ9_9RHOB|nr:hypothetical protein [Pikeienuella piscinae]QIE55881.1 hypothetical protein G5B40_10740 [Pikeienuella piscinae]